MYNILKYQREKCSKMMRTCQKDIGFSLKSLLLTKSGIIYFTQRLKLAQDNTRDNIKRILFIAVGGKNSS